MIYGVISVSTMHVSGIGAFYLKTVISQLTAYQVPDEGNCVV
jgi:hypothetical protein